MATATWSPGSLVSARGREWVVLTGSTSDVLRVRPVSGSEDDQTVIHVGLEADPVREARFPMPLAHQRAGHDAALLLRDALLLSLRRGAGPFRALGQVAVEPRAYQLVPLLMALKLDPVRLLIADDVGIGKTIEAGLIARELLDRGDINRTAILCPPHLVDQWIGELDRRFHLHAVAVTAAGASRLERGLPPGESIFTAHQHTVVSLDYIKSDRRRDEFLRAAPEFVIVDEAHTCTSTGQGRHQRYELLRGLTASAERHIVLLTATPHSGDEAAFYRLLGLLDRRFEQLAEADEELRRRLRDDLSRHFVQRRRQDIDEWVDGSALFPRRETQELRYALTGEWEQLFSSVLDYCASVVEAAEGDARRQRLSFWGTLALMRCVASSPAAAVQALRTRADLDTSEDDDALFARVFDGATDSLPDDDLEPSAGADDPVLRGLIDQAERLTGQHGDPKLRTLVEHVAALVEEGFNPVVFCRYIATAHYLGQHLEKQFRDVSVAVVTGELTAEERVARVEALAEAEEERRLLVATDCLSEGVNLQHAFDAVVHYDLSWNPTRHEQREGRVDRFGQRRSAVRATLMYGSNNPVDGAVLDVILRKARKIREELGVPVPLPDEGQALTEVLLKALLLRHGNRSVGIDTARQMQLFDDHWHDAADRAKRSRATVFAQRRLKPEEVLPEWHKTIAAVGGSDDVRRFAGRARARLGAGLDPLPRQGFRAPLNGLPADVKERLESEGLTGTVFLDFAEPPAPRCRVVLRTHPLVSVLAETLLERTLAHNGDSASPTSSDPGVLGRVGCWVAPGVTSITTVALLRIRHQLVTQRQGQSRTLLVEEAGAIAWVGQAGTPVEGDEALALLAPDPLADPPPPVRDRAVSQSLEQLDARLGQLDAFAERRAEALLADHRRVREAAGARGSYAVRALVPPDVIGLFVLLPAVK
jgi:superfamily II DNA or RNA helicase